MFRLGEHAYQSAIGIPRQRLVSETLESTEETVHGSMKGVDDISHAASGHEGAADHLKWIVARKVLARADVP
jgi:hypothetical protein